MTADDGCEARGCRIEVEPVKIVQHVERDAPQVDNFDRGKIVASTTFIDIALNSGDWRDFTKLAQDFGIADITSMQYVLYPCQGS